MEQRLTHGLLALIAGLLLILVMLTFINLKRQQVPGKATTSSSTWNEDDFANPPAMAEQQEFDHMDMLYASFVCPDNATLTLAHDECSSAEADKRRSSIQTAISKDLPLSKVFDSLIAEFGEGVLTAEALDIIRARNQ